MSQGLCKARIVSGPRAPKGRELQMIVTNIQYLQGGRVVMVIAGIRSGKISEAITATFNSCMWGRQRILSGSLGSRLVERSSFTKE